jgi:hypothetical protein
MIVIGFSRETPTESDHDHGKRGSPRGWLTAALSHDQEGIRTAFRIGIPS